LQQFTDRRLVLATLRRSLHVLRAEIRELRSENRELLRQLVIEQAKVERSHFCWISNDGLVRR
jgi:hypothetical protein